MYDYYDSEFDNEYEDYTDSSFDTTEMEDKSEISYEFENFCSSDTSVEGQVEYDLTIDTDDVSDCYENKDVDSEEHSWRTDLFSHSHITEKMLEASEVAPNERTWRETELVEEMRNPSYSSQKAFIINENGEMEDCSRNDKGANVPDLYLENDDGSISLKEVKNYNDFSNLKHNIQEQSSKRAQALTDYDYNLTFTIAPNFTTEEAYRLQNFVENELGDNIEFQLK